VQTNIISHREVKAKPLLANDAQIGWIILGIAGLRSRKYAPKSRLFGHF